jgi:hypothetical protein
VSATTIGSIRADGWISVGRTDQGDPGRVVAGPGRVGGGLEVADELVRVQVHQVPRVADQVPADLAGREGVGPVVQAVVEGG